MRKERDRERREKREIYRRKQRVRESETERWEGEEVKEVDT